MPDAPVRATATVCRKQSAATREERVGGFGPEETGVLPDATAHPLNADAPRRCLVGDAVGIGGVVAVAQAIMHVDVGG